MWKLVRVAFLSVLAAVLWSSCVDNRCIYRRYEGAVWNTTFSIVYRSDKQLDDSIREVMRRVESSLSPFSESSLVSGINRGESDVTDSLFRRIFLASQEVNRLSGGAFDPTVSPLVNLWGFGYKDGDGEPSGAEIDSALESVGILRCRLDGERVVKVSEKTEFNFSAITKGCGTDLVGEMLARNGCEDYMVEIGGEMALRGRNPHGEPWHVMVDAPFESDSAAVHSRLAVIHVSDCGVATSGNYRNFRDTSKGRVGHTISPVTGRPVVTETLSVTVVAANAMMADALATACMAMRADSAMVMIEGLEGVSAMFVSVDDEGEWRIETSSRFPEIYR